MTTVEQIMWDRNKKLMDEHLILTRALALILISPNHESAINEAKEAFAKLDAFDPFAKAPEIAAEKVGEAA